MVMFIHKGIIVLNKRWFNLSLLSFYFCLLSYFFLTFAFHLLTFCYSFIDSYEKTFSYDNQMVLSCKKCKSFYSMDTVFNYIRERIGADRACCK